MLMPPSTPRSETSGCWRWKHSGFARSRSCSRFREQSEQPEVPDGLVMRAEIARRGSAPRGVAQVVARHPRLCQDPEMATSTPFPTRSRAS